MQIYKVSEVFTPNAVPTVSYVQRSTLELEKRLKAAIRTPGLITSISGPSKTGKTVLVKKVINDEDIIPVSGASIKSPEDLWQRVLGWMKSPSEMQEEENDATAYTASGEVSGGVGIPGFGKLGGKGGGGITTTGGTKVAKKIVLSPIDQVVKEIAGSDFIVFIDDFHYMSADVQYSVARQIKEVAEKGLKICTASVPHRSDDVVRSNTELRGRVQAIDVGYWSPEQIRQIAMRGFAALNIELEDSAIDRLVDESFGSPQLMQGICLQLCYACDVEKTLPAIDRFDLNEAIIDKIFERTSTTTDFSTLLEALHTGPKLRGQERKEFAFYDESKGDVYRSALLALRTDPPAMTFRYDEMMQRIKSVCEKDAPVGSSVNEALKQMDKIAKEIQPTAAVIEWNEDVLDLVDPYFLFYLRCSDRLRQLG